ncbi:hypothetical protein I3760_01G104300 [Carya illinoinensis]|nr:hypothetical protein I3760_01G104300 [Carya illinoinensis]
MNLRYMNPCLYALVVLSKHSPIIITKAKLCSSSWDFKTLLTPFQAQILLYDPLPTINRVLSLIQQEERCRQLHSIPAPILMATQGPDSHHPRRDKLYCSHCNASSHSLERCFKANLNLPVCSHCCIPGHTKEKCYKIHGFPPGHKNFTRNKSSANHVFLEQEQAHNGKPITQEQYSRLIALLNAPKADTPLSTANHAHATPSNPSILPTFGTTFCFSAHTHEPTCEVSWIIDFGATDHMICSPKFFTHITTLVGHAVRLPNGSTVVATHIGDVHLSSNLIIKNALCVPTFSLNLISTKSLTRSSNSCLFILFFLILAMRTFTLG